MSVLEKLLKAMGFDVKPEQLEVLEDAVKPTTVPTVEDKSKDSTTGAEGTVGTTNEPTKDNVDNTDNKGEDNMAENAELKALQEKLATMEAMIAKQAKEAKILSMVTDTKDKDLVLSLVGEAENPEEAVKALRTSKPFLFNEIPAVTGSEDQQIKNDFDKYFDEHYLK